MAAVPRQNTAPELLLRKALHRLGYRYRLHVRSLPGTPDIVFPALRVAVFVHGCFWHRHSGCKFASSPSSRRQFWEDKFAANVARDRHKEEELATAGWTVVVVWQCQIQHSLPDAVSAVERMLSKVKGNVC
jgi:DNA mismatch endonuclease (patch repair protein)